MAISSVSSLPTNALQQATSATSSLLDPSQFLQLLTIQLQNQDPLNPVSDTDFTSQLAQLSTLSSMQQLNTSFQQLIQIQQLGQGAALVGKVVQYTPSGSSTVSQGLVTSVSIQNGQLFAQVNGTSVPAAQIQGISKATAQQAAGS